MVTILMLITHVSGRDRWSTGREFGSIVHEGDVTNLGSLLEVSSVEPGFANVAQQWFRVCAT